MLLIKRPERGAIWPASFLSGAAFISCVGPQEPGCWHRLNAAFGNGGADTSPIVPYRRTDRQDMLVQRRWMVAINHRASRYFRGWIGVMSPRLVAPAGPAGPNGPDGLRRFVRSVRPLPALRCRSNVPSGVTLAVIIHDSTPFFISCAMHARRRPLLID
jgi:hypothetical protein